MQDAMTQAKDAVTHASPDARAIALALIALAEPVHELLEIARRESAR